MKGKRETETKTETKFEKLAEKRQIQLPLYRESENAQGGPQNLRIFYPTVLFSQDDPGISFTDLKINAVRVEF